METKISKLRTHMEAGDWQKAISLAAKFPRLGAHRNAILDAQLAFQNPNFCLGIKKDPQTLIEAGKKALIAAYTSPRGITT